MKAIELIRSGLLEEYVLGALDSDSTAMVRHAIATDASVREEVAQLELALENMNAARAVQQPPGVRDNLLSAVSDQLAEAKGVDRPPILHPASKAADYAQWIEQPGMVEDPSNEDTYFVPFAMNDEAMTALVWMRKGAPVETHTDCIEKFLILEGTCNIIIGTTVHPMRAGDYMRIPMYIPHSVVVTSDITCRIIVQRVAA